MGNAGTKAAEFAETVKGDASEFVQKLIGDANNFAVVAEMLAIPPTRPFNIQNEELREAAEHTYKGIDFEAINIGVIGGPGTGKVSLINSLLQQPRFAAIPIVADEEVRAATQFADPTYHHVRYWYLPDDYGDGAPSLDYFSERCLFAFDIILILVATNKIRLGDIELAKQAYVIDPPMPVAFVRTKMDGQLIAQIGRVSGSTQWDNEKERIGNRMRAALRKQLDDGNLHETPVYLISQAGILDVNGKETNDHRYVMDEYQFFNFLVQSLQERRYVDGGD